MAVRKHPGRLLEHYKGYKIFEVRTYGTKNVITSTNLTVYGKKWTKKGDKFKNKGAAKAFIDKLAV
jgi:hypothetical protein